LRVGVNSTFSNSQILFGCRWVIIIIIIIIAIVGVVVVAI